MRRTRTHISDDIRVSYQLTSVMAIRCKLHVSYENAKKLEMKFLYDRALDIRVRVHTTRSSIKGPFVFGRKESGRKYVVHVIDCKECRVR